MRPFRPRSRVPTLAVVLMFASLSSGCIAPGQEAQGETTPRLEGQRLAGATPQE